MKQFTKIIPVLFSCLCILACLAILFNKSICLVIKTINIRPDENLYTYQDYMFLYSDRGLRILKNEKKIWEEAFELENSQIRTAEEMIAIGDQNRILIYSTSGRCYGIEKQNIVDFFINANGYLAIVTQDQEAFHIFVADDAGNIIFQDTNNIFEFELYSNISAGGFQPSTTLKAAILENQSIDKNLPELQYLQHGKLNQVTLSDNNQYLAFSYDFKTYSDLYLYDIEKQHILGQPNRYVQMIRDVEFLGSQTFAYRTEEYIKILSLNNDSEDVFPFDSILEEMVRKDGDTEMLLDAFFLDNSYYLVEKEGDPFQNSKTVLLKKIAYKGNQVRTVELKNGYQRIYETEKGIIVQDDKYLHYYSDYNRGKGKLNKWNYPYKDNIRNAMMYKNKLAIVTDNKIKLIKILL